MSEGLFAGADIRSLTRTDGDWHADRRATKERRREPETRPEQDVVRRKTATVGSEPDSQSAGEQGNRRAAITEARDAPSSAERLESSPTDYGPSGGYAREAALKSTQEALENQPIRRVRVEWLVCRSR